MSIPDIKHPRYTYAVTKMLGESAFLNYSKAFDFKCTIVRYHNVFGPRMGFSHVIPNLVDRFMHGNEDPFMMQGHDQTRTFCYITDAIEATILAMESKKTHGEIYHIGADKEITIETLIKKCGEFFNYQGLTNQHQHSRINTRDVQISQKHLIIFLINPKLIGRTVLK